MRKPILFVVIVCLLSVSLSAQNTPAPAAPPSPFTGYLGRFLDSAATVDYFGPNRTLRTDKIKIDGAHDRIYIRAGNGYFVAYTLSTFASRMGSSFATGPHGEQYLPWAMYVNPETNGLWSTINADGAVRLSDFDFDARGYIYLAYTLFGWGIVDQNGQKLAQIVNQTSYPTPRVILTFAFGTHQYAMVSDTSTSNLWDVTDPRSLFRTTTMPLAGISKYAKTAAGDAIAIISGGQLRIYTPDQLVNNGTPVTIQPTLAVASPSFTDVTTDGVNFYASQDGSGSVVISKISPSNGGYTSAEQLAVPNLYTQSLTYGSGYVAWTGLTTVSSATQSAGALYDATLNSRTDISSYLQTNYPYGAYIVPKQLAAYCNDAGTFALFAAHGLGDLFGLTPTGAACLPGAPTSVTATAGNGSADVSFTAPASDGGAAITSYVVTSNPHGITATGTTSPITISGLANGQAYTFTVAAVNSVGAGAQSVPSNSVTPSGPLSAPASIMATANGTNLVHVQWTAATGALYYEVLRTSTIGGTATTFRPGNNFALALDDPTVTPGTTYLYQVRSVDAAGTRSANSPIDVATTIVFTDDPLIGGSTTVLAAHLTELRTAVSAMRAAASLTAYAFTDATLDSTVPIKAVHVTELRSALDEARSTIGVAAIAYSESITAGVTPVKAIHLQEIRNGVK